MSRSILRYMEEHSTTSFKVSYCGTEKSMLEYLHGVRMDTLTIKSAIDTCVSRALSAYFGSHYPEFPRFRSPITQENQANIRIAAMEVLGGRPQKLGTDTLEALGLLLNGKIKPENSPYATYYIQLLSKLPEGSVLNYSDIMESASDGLAGVDKKFLLTDMLMSLVLSSLIYGGFCIMVADNNVRYDASNVDALVHANPLDLFRFKRLEKPKAAPVLRLRRLFGALSVNDGLIMNAGTWDTAVEELLKRTKELSDTVFHFGSFLDKSTYLWGDSIIPTNQADKFRQEIQPLKKLYDDIRSRFNSAAKLKNCDYTDDQLASVEKAVDTVNVLKGIETFKGTVGELMQYLSSAEMKVEEGTTLRVKFAKQKEAYLDMRAELLLPDYDEAHTDDLLDALEALKKEYIDYYMEQHKACRLGIKDAQRRQKILDGMTVYKLKTLAQLTGILTTGKYNDLVSHQLADIKVCYECTGTEMQSHVECPHCGFVPAGKESAVAGRLDAIETKLEEMLENWRETLLDMLANDPMLVDRKRYMSAELQPLIDGFIESKRFPDDLNGFVRAVREAFADYECVEMNEDEFIEEVLSWGTLSPDAFKKRMGEYVDKLVGKRNKDQVRLAFCDGHQTEV